MKKAFINSLPKAGTNLLAQCLVLFGYRDKRTLFGEKAGLGSFLVKANTIPSLIRRVLWASTGDGYCAGIDSPVFLPRRPVDRLLSGVKDGQFMTGHIGYDSAILDKLVDLDIKPFLIIRDPRAILSSFVNYVLSEPKHPLHRRFINISLKQCYYEALYGIDENSLSLMSLPRRCSALDPWIESASVVLVKFEHLVGAEGGGNRQDQMDTLYKIADVLGIDTERVEYVADNVFGLGRATFSKGKVNSWEEDMPATIVSEAEELLAPVLEKWSYIQT